MIVSFFFFLIGEEKVSHRAKFHVERLSCLLSLRAFLHCTTIDIYKGRICDDQACQGRVLIRLCLLGTHLDILDVISTIPSFTETLLCRSQLL